MKAALCLAYGPSDGIRIAEVPTPVPKRGEMLIRIHASTISSADWRIRSMSVPPPFGLIMRLIFGIRRPRNPIFGTEFSGIVEKLGPDVTRFRPGDAVIAFAGAKMGGHAEYRVLPATAPIIAKPRGMSFAEAAALSFGGSTALHFLRDKAKVKAGDKVLVIGASGSVGSAAVQIGKAFGAEVTGVTSRANLDLVRGLGAAHVIDYGASDFTKNGQLYDIIADTADATNFARCQASLAPGGRYLMIAAVGLGQMLGALRSGPEGRRAIGGVAPERAEDMETLADLFQSGAYRPLIERRYPLADIVAAWRHVDTGRKKGNVVIEIVDETTGTEKEGA